MSNAPQIKHGEHVRTWPVLALAAAAFHMTAAEPDP